MPAERFLQLHTLHGYAGVLLNRDEAGLAKRLTYGNHVRTRVSSQRLKRHWRTLPAPTRSAGSAAPRARPARARRSPTACSPR